MREGERFTDELDEIANMLYEVFKESFGVVLCCESPIEIIGHKPYPIWQRICKGTKYLRLSSLLGEDTSDYFLSVDNDVRGNMEELKIFVSIAVEEELDIAWGKIRARQYKGLFSGLVAVDKLISHNILRPALWKLKVGISIPGQCFWIKRETFAGKLPQIDTFLDDLGVGLEVSRRYTDLKMKTFPSVLGYETPNETFSGLWRQRSRWAKGYASILLGVKTGKDKKKVVIHGFAYHFFWIFSWLTCFFLARVNWLLAVLYLSGISFVIGGRMFIYAFLYQLLFPIFHICWIVTMLKEVISKGKKHAI
jgi:cellulose synthase/poly-beta-1,6-N-acetylglucosamine synthase-like glycosyltransferase